MSLADVDRGLLGREFDRVAYGPFTAAEFIAYARALGETDPVYVDEQAARRGPNGGLCAHPSFVVRLRSSKLVPDEIARHMTRSGFDAGKDIEFGVPLRPGDTVTVVSTAHEIYEKTGRSGAMVFLVLRSVATNQRGETVAVIDSRLMQRARADEEA